MKLINNLKQLVKGEQTTPRKIADSVLYGSDLFQETFFEDLVAFREHIRSMEDFAGFYKSGWKVLRPIIEGLIESAMRRNTNIKNTHEQFVANAACVGAYRGIVDEIEKLAGEYQFDKDFHDDMMRAINESS